MPNLIRRPERKGGALNGYPCDCLLLAFILTAAFIGSICFLVGWSLSPWCFWGAFTAIAVCAFIKSPKSAALFFLGMVVLLALTAYTFTYAGPDAVFYHVPTQLLLKKGWNPVWTSTCESFFSSVENIAWFRPYHVLFLPHFNALCGAIVALGIGLWIGDPFLNYTLLVVLFNVARRFSKQVWGCSTFASIVFSVSMTFSPKVTSFLGGQVDYIVYATFFIACFAAYLALKDGMKRDWFLLFAALSIGALSKNNGIICGGFVVLGCLWPMRKNKIFWYGVAATVVYCLVVGASPYLTNWINYGSPFYPTHTFRSGVELIDITDDFVGNADAESMGYLSRIAYAWVSPSLTIKLLGWLRGCSFSPEFYVSAGVAGSGSAMRFMLLFGLLALLLSKKSFITLLCAMIFLLSNFAPLKYIGYSRYFPWIWGIPILALYQFSYARYDWRVFRSRLFGVAASVVVLACGTFMAMRSVVYYLKDFAWEAARQQRIQDLACLSKTWVGVSPKYSLDDLKHVNGFFCEYGLAFRDRLRLDGVEIVSGTKGFPLMHDHGGFELFPGDKDENGKLRELKSRFPPCPTVKDVLCFDWIGALRRIPHPLIDNLQGCPLEAAGRKGRCRFVR